MDFYTIVIIISVVLLILSLTAIGLLVTNASSTAKFPESYNSCPDYWSFDGTFCKPNKGINIGTLSNPSAYTPSKDICVNRTWSNDNKISWDGVSNTNSC
jgi:hypothetical protein